jgi:hypothetical protein
MCPDFRGSGIDRLGDVFAWGPRCFWVFWHVVCTAKWPASALRQSNAPEDTAILERAAVGSQCSGGSENVGHGWSQGGGRAARSLREPIDRQEAIVATGPGKEEVVCNGDEPYLGARSEPPAPQSLVGRKRPEQRRETGTAKRGRADRRRRQLPTGWKLPLPIERRARVQARMNPCPPVLFCCSVIEQV